MKKKRLASTFQSLENWKKGKFETKDLAVKDVIHILRTPRKEGINNMETLRSWTELTLQENYTNRLLPTKNTLFNHTWEIDYVIIVAFHGSIGKCTKQPWLALRWIGACILWIFLTSMLQQACLAFLDGSTGYPPRAIIQHNMNVSFPQWHDTNSNHCFDYFQPHGYLEKRCNHCISF